MRILTAFTNSLGGRDSYHLGVSLAEAFSCPLDLVTVVKGGGGRYVLDVTDHAFQDVVATQVDDWMSEIMEEHRPRVPVGKCLRYSLSFPEGIIASAEELKADLLVAGGGRHGVLGRAAPGAPPPPGVVADPPRLLASRTHIDLQTLLTCGMVIAGLGVLNDVTITQASSVWELHAANPLLSRTRPLTGRAGGARPGVDTVINCSIFSKGRSRLTSSLTSR